MPALEVELKVGDVLRELMLAAVAISTKNGIAPNRTRPERPVSQRLWLQMLEPIHISMADCGSRIAYVMMARQAQALAGPEKNRRSKSRIAAPWQSGIAF